MSRSSVELKEPLPALELIVSAVSALKQTLDRDLLVMGSGELIQSLMRHNLVDTFVLMIHPIVLGAGRRLFTEGGPDAALQLVETKTTTTGVVIATYVPSSERSQ